MGFGSRVLAAMGMGCGSRALAAMAVAVSAAF